VTKVPAILHHRFQRPTKWIVLAVEDEPEDAAFLRQAFEKVRPDFFLRTATDGESAIAYLSGQAPYQDRARNPLPNVILLDLGLPRMSGLEVLRWIRSRSEFQETPVVILTSSTVPDDLRNAYAAGTSSFIPKPADGRGFAGLIEALCRFWELNVR